MFLKHIYLTVFVHFFFILSLRAQNFNAIDSVYQNGFRNYAEINQNAINAVAKVEQIGDANTAIINQNSIKQDSRWPSRSTIQQTCDSSRATIFTDDKTYSTTSTIVQKSNNSDAIIMQQNTLSDNTIYQESGKKNIASIDFSGAHIKYIQASIHQIGNENNASVKMSNIIEMDNGASITQQGNRNFSLVKGEMYAYVRQYGDDNNASQETFLDGTSDTRRASQTQEGTFNIATINTNSISSVSQRQIGNFNTAQITNNHWNYGENQLQNGDFNKAIILQNDAYSCFSLQEQIGDNNSATIVQEHAEDGMASQHQTGDDNSATLYQAGLGNNASQIQQGNRLFSIISQQGSSNIAHSKQKI